ncbi:MAG: type transport system permease protein [Thermoleophilaceae bacterium]|nr:type transport system permease protein [Thermoleophilaceae bacterium]
MNAISDEMRIVRGPSALGQDAGRFFALTRTLTLTDFRLKFYGSALGYLWQLMRPLMLFGVLYFVFTHFIKFGAGVQHYPSALLMGIVLYGFISEAIANSVDSVVAREPLVRKIQFPRLVIPTSVVATSLLNLMLNLIAVFGFMLANGVRPNVRWLELPVILLAAVALAGGVAMIVSALFVRYRDVKPITDVVLQVLFYATPIFYPVEKITDLGLRHPVMMINPFAPIVQQARHAMIDSNAPSAAAAAGGTLNLMVPVFVILGLVAVGFWIFNREAPRIAEEL